MEPGGRKLLPRVQPASAERDRESVEPTRNGSRAAEAQDGVPSQRVWRSPMEEESGPKRKRQQLEEHHVRSQAQAQAQALPSLRHLLTGPTQTYSVESEKSGHARLIRASKDAYIHEGPYKFLAPYPSRDFPTTVSADSRELSFAVVEPELMDVFRRAWYLRHYIRLKRLQGEHWLDHIFFNDSYGIENTLYTWTSRYEPGTLQYPASMLYKHCVWLFFHRSIQASQPSPAFAQVVEDGLHFLRTIVNALGAAGDRSILLISLFLLGVAAFYPEQRRDVWEALDGLDPSVSNESVNHAARSLERIWGMMEDGRITSTWDWERYQAHENTMSTGDRTLIDLLWDPLAPVAQPSRVRSPEAYDFDPSRFRAVQAQAPPPPASAPAPQPPPPDSIPKQQEADMYTPPRTRSPPRHHSTASTADAADAMRVDGHPENNPSQPEIASGPRPFLAPPPPPANYQANHDVIQVLHRKSAKTKSSVPPCPTCGKELKNPSDAQKHQLQHSKPFRCREPGCTRTQGFATENDLQRHRKSVHGASPRIGNKIGYICVACPEPSDGTSRKWWPRLDNFKAHIRRKHQEADEEGLIQASASARRPGDEIYIEPSYPPNSLRWPEERLHEQSIRRAVQDSQYDYHGAHDYGGGGDDDDDGVGVDGDGDEVHEKRENSQSDQGLGEEISDGRPSRSPKSESDVSNHSEAMAMDVSPTNE